MAKPKTKTQIIAKVADDAGIAKKEAKAAIESLVQQAYKGAKDGFTVPGLGKLVKQRRKARKGRNPQTGEAIKIKARNVVKFKPGKKLRESI